MSAQFDPTSTTSELGSCVPFTVMLVDDDSDCRALVRDAISELGSGYRVIERENGKDATDYLFAGDSIKPNVIFLDLEMPRMGGLEALEMIKSHPRLKEIPVIILTGVDDDNAIERAALLGANSYTLKPSKVEEFIQTILASANYWLTVHQYSRRQHAAGPAAS